jgi:AcrR family transcriptional regulator
MRNRTTSTEDELDAGADEQGGDRRLQVLRAAEACFQKHGFHATSIQRISELAGMSPGHIYHYFRNKEAIVAGIVEQRLAGDLQRVERLRRDGRTAAALEEALIAEVEPGIKLRQDRAALDIEILAEATRNPAVAALVQQADAVSRARVMSLFRQLPSLQKLPPKELAARLVVIRAIVNGLAIRSVCDPTLNRAATMRVVKQVVRMLLEETI